MVAISLPKVLFVHIFLHTFDCICLTESLKLHLFVASLAEADILNIVFFSRTWWCHLAKCCLSMITTSTVYQPTLGCRICLNENSFVRVLNTFMNTQHEQSSPSYLAALQRQLYQRDPKLPFWNRLVLLCCRKTRRKYKHKIWTWLFRSIPQSTYRFVVMTMLIITAMMLIILMTLIVIIIKLMMV